MSKKRRGANGEWPRVPTFLDLPEHPPGMPSGDHITLDEEDERILDQVWAEVRSRPTKLFGQTLPRLPSSASESDVAADAAQAQANGQLLDGQCGAHREVVPGPAKRSRKPAAARRAI